MVRDEPLLGTGAGSFEAHWFRERSVAFHARDAHNLYLETLAELGPVGLALLLATLALPLLALPAARRFAHAPAAVGAYAAYLVHAGVDWDWEIPAVTVPAIFCAAVLLAVERPDEAAVADGQAPRLSRSRCWPRSPLSRSSRTSATAPPRRASPRPRPETRSAALAEAKRATAWAPWSEEAWQLRGEAELELGDAAAARRSLPRALDRNPESWSAWLDLAAASRGRRAASRPSIERRPSTRSAPRSMNSEQILNEWQRRGSPRRRVHRGRPVTFCSLKGAQLSNPSRKRSRIAAAAAMVVCLLAALAALGGVGAAQSAISSAQGAYGKKVTICHKGKKTISIGKAAWPAHQRHGDTLGTCASAAAKAAKAKKAKAAKAAKIKAAKAKAAKAKAEAAKANAEKAKAEKAEKKQDKSPDTATTPARATARGKAEKARSPHS